MRRTVAIAGALLLVSGAPSAHAAVGHGTDHRVRPTITVAVTPRYPQEGRTATLSIHVGGAHGNAAGWVRVRFNGTVIPACSHLTLRAGSTTCTAPRTWVAKRTFLVGYKGSSVYAPEVVTRIAWA